MKSAKKAKKLKKIKKAKLPKTAIKSSDKREVRRIKNQYRHKHSGCVTMYYFICIGCSFEEQMQKQNVRKDMGK